MFAGQGVFQHDNGSGRAWSGFPSGRGRLAHFPVRQNAGQVVSNQQHNHVIHVEQWDTSQGIVLDHSKQVKACNTGVSPMDTKTINAPWVLQPVHRIRRFNL